MALFKKDPLRRHELYSEKDVQRYFKTKEAAQLAADKLGKTVCYDPAKGKYYLK
ncbi:MAG: hypothetical protein IJV31_09690 [Clostridia bacterium]|nr:hypothetical protein [Clostridia bacterium]